MKIHWKLSCLVVMALMVGCATEPYDYTALEASRPKSILVIPPANDSVEVNAPYVFLSTITRPLAERGYYVFPVAVVEQFLKENGLPTSAEMNQVPAEKLADYFGADALLYVTINDWGQKYHVLNSTAEVNANVRLLDAKTGQLLWDAPFVAVQSSGDGGAGLAGMLVAALVDQVVGSVVDKTQGLSRAAAHAAINNKNRGLLYGPYVQPAAAQ